MPVYRFALALTNDLADADDVAQEAFVRLWRSRATIDWSAAPIGWLLVAARRVALDRFRSLGRELRLRPAPVMPAGLDATTIEAFVDLLMVLVSLLPYVLIAGLIAAAGSYVIQHVNF